MIDPKLLTAENGFEDGVVVEIDHQFMRWNGINTHDDDYMNWIVGEYEDIDPSTVESIKVLTGPMSIWNHAPEWAEWLVRDNVSFRWYKSQPSIYLNALEARPFWATRIGE